MISKKELRMKIRKIIEGSLSAALNKAVADDPYMDPYESEAQKKRYPKKQKKQKRDKKKYKMSEGKERLNLEHEIRALEDDLDSRPVKLRTMTFSELLDYKYMLEQELHRKEAEGLVPFLE